MAIIRSLSIIVALAVTTVLFPLGTKATAETQKAPSPDAIFEVYSEFYMFQRHVEFSLEMATRESYLTWLYQGINTEVRKRRKEDLNGTLNALSPPELKGYSESDYSFPEDIDPNSSRDIYLALENYQRDEFDHKFLQTRLIKNRLIKSATPAQRARMFKNDLETAVLNYRDGHYRDAIVRFDELIGRYGYADINDIVFYRAESYFAIQLYHRAAEDYKRVLKAATDEEIQRRSLERIIVINADRGDLGVAQEYWKQYIDRYGENRDENYWMTHGLMARYQMAGGNWRDAQALFDMIPSSTEGFIQAKLQAAQCALQMLDLEDAEKRIIALWNGNIDGVQVPSAVKQQARFNLGLVDFLYGDYDLAFINLSKAKVKGEMQEMAVIGSAWALYKLGASEEVIKICNEFLEEHPESQYQYEAISLIGYCRELIGKDSLAVADYKRIMSAVDDRQEYRDINHERLVLTKAKDELMELEEVIFLQNRRDLFSRYMELKKTIRLLSEKIQLAETYKTSPFIKDLLVEQRLVYKAYTDRLDLQQQIFESEDTKLINQYDEVVHQLQELANQLSAGIKFHIGKTTLIQREEKDRFSENLSDSIQFRVNEEWEAIESTRNTLRTTLENLDDDVSVDLLMRLTDMDLRLYNQQDKLLLFQRYIDQNQPRALQCNLDQWSDFAYQRYTYKGLDFDEFYLKQDRAGNLDDYIQQVSQVIALRRKIEADTLKLMADLVPDVSKSELYHAPVVPLWSSDAAWIENIELEWRGELPVEYEPSLETESHTGDDLIEEDESIESEDFEMDEGGEESIDMPTDMPSDQTEEAQPQPDESSGQDEVEETPGSEEGAEFEEFEEEMIPSTDEGESGQDESPAEEEATDQPVGEEDQTPNEEANPETESNSGNESPVADDPPVPPEEPSDP